MICQRCHKNEANLHIEQNVSGIEKHIDLCGQCAFELGIGTGQQLFQQLLSATTGLSAFNGTLLSGQMQEEGGQQRERCSSCATTFSEFQHSGLFGCPDCYRSFSHHLERIFKRLQAGKHHEGRAYRMSATAAAPSAKELPAEKLSAEKLSAKSLSAEDLPADALSQQDHFPAAETILADAIKAVERKPSLEELLQLQKAAVKREDYIEAAQLRDAIAALKADAAGKDQD